ncbi:MAG: ABC transporter permease [Dehalococcoidales bacterium]|jgi:peptide/nickel transport system permease protein|nr:ABC transporter permease [Dehalococcoidales bacterium]
MTAYIIRRLIQSLIVLIIVTLLVFFVMRLLPGDPLIIYMAQSADLEAMPPEMLQQLRHQFGLDKPIMIQYANWVANIFQGDFGTSIYYREKVGKLMLERFPVTLHIGLTSLVLGGVIGILAGMLAAIRRGKLLDRIITPLTYIGITIPVFWLGILLIYMFGLKLNWLPISGYTSPMKDFWLSTRQIIMPVLCLSAFGVAANARQMRSAMLEVTRQDYIRTAWAKGLSERLIIIRHALKNSLIPVITLMGIGVGTVFGGSVLVETVFAIPGVGRLLVSSIFGQDYVVVQAITFVIAVIVLFVNLLVDLSYGWFDPRIRYG